MIQILGIVDWNEIGFNIIAGLYGTVARIYDIMLSLTGYYKEGGVPDNYVITTSNVMTTMYTLAGVFMLFRVTISMINMLIDPDKVSDSQAGAGKLLTRIITSLLLLLLFVPEGYIFSKNPDNPGILMRIEKALLSEDGLINNIMPEVNGEKSSLEGSVKNNDFLIDNVNAKLPSDTGDTSKPGYDCYYVYLTRSNSHLAQLNHDEGSTPSSEMSITRVMHLKLYDNNTNGSSGYLCSPRKLGDGKIGKDCSKYSYNTDSTKPYTSEKGNMVWDRLKNGWPSTHNCPNVIEIVGGDDNNASDGYGSAGDWKKIAFRYVGGWHSLDAMKKDVKESGLPAAGSNAQEIADLLGINYENSFIFGASQQSIDFAQSALSSFLQCTGSGDDCKGLKSRMLLSINDNKEVVKALNADPPIMTLDFMIGVVAGIGLVIWIAILCVDVIIRRFKLMLLEMMAPIPIIAYADPKDETFNKWGKMYISTYADLFLKLIAIAFAIVLLQNISGAMDDQGLLKFFYLIAILLFAKMIPDMISKVFGIQLGSGTFKDIAGMYKKALGFGAGAIAGGVAGVATGISAFNATKGHGLGNKLLEAARGTKGVLTGIAQGAASGSKGNVLGGAKNIAAVNAGVRSKYASGLKASHLLEAATLGKIGMDRASMIDIEIEKDVAQRDKIMKLTKYIGEIGKLSREGGLMKQVQSAKLNGFSLDSAAEQELAIEYAEAMRSGEDAKAFKQRMEGHDKYGSIYQSLFSDSRFSEIDTTTGQTISGFDWNNADSFVDGGVKAQIQGVVDNFNYDITRSPSLGRVVGKSEIKTVFDVKEANLGAWNGTKIKDANGNDVMVPVRDQNGNVVRDANGNVKQEAARTEGVNVLNKRINDKINTPEYAASKAAKNSSNNDDKK